MPSDRQMNITNWRFVLQRASVTADKVICAQVAQAAIRVNA